MFLIGALLIVHYGLSNKGVYVAIYIIYAASLSIEDNIINAPPAMKVKEYGQKALEIY